jgi:hypothetical protein
MTTLTPAVVMARWSEAADGRALRVTAWDHCGTPKPKQKLMKQ